MRRDRGSTPFAVRVKPSLEDVLRHTGDETHVALAVELAADTETPISLYAKLSGDRPSAFLLESADSAESIGRYSFIGFDLSRVLSFGGAAAPDSSTDPL